MSVKVYAVHHIFTSYRNGGKECEIYFYKNKELAEKKANELHMVWCEKDSNGDGDVVESDGTDSHSYETCYNDESEIFVNEKMLNINDNEVCSLKFNC